MLIFIITIKNDDQIINVLIYFKKHVTSILI